MIVTGKMCLPKWLQVLKIEIEKERRRFLAGPLPKALVVT